MAAIITLAIAAPVLRAPSERVFGMEIAGRHHDPFTVMRQFDGPIAAGIYSQPLTDIPGALLARVAGPVAAYNWLVLLTFPLSAVTAFLLARYLALSPAGAAVAAIAYAFAPFHLAQSAYHPHIAQTQWMPLYLLALWRCLDEATAASVALLGAATAAVALSNFYGGLIAAVVTPVAVAAYWLTAGRTAPRRMRNLAVTAGSLVAIAAGAILYASHEARAVVLHPAAYGFPRGDLFLYSAKWWSYLVPPVEQPLLGGMARRIWIAAGVREGLLEQQVTLGWGLVALALVAIFGWTMRRHDTRQPPSIARVPVLAVLAFAALLCSLSPERTIGSFTFVRPSAFLYDIVPMFRSYARFGLVVQLMTAILAGIAVDSLRAAGSRSARVLCAALITLAAAEYAVSPFALWRDVLPTRAHRWVTRQPGRVHALDCAPVTQESASVPWLTDGRITLPDAAIADCAEPDLAARLAANGYTHLIVRRGTPESQWFDDHAPPSGLRVAALFADGRVFAVTEGPPPVYTAGMTGFFARERDGARSWRWMSADAEWTIVSTAGPVEATLEIQAWAFAHSRRMDVLLDGRPVQTLVVGLASGPYRIGPLTMGAGSHRLTFHPVEEATADPDGAGHGDRRRLSFAIGAWTWTAYRSMTSRIFRPSPSEVNGLCRNAIPGLRTPWCTIDSSVYPDM